MSPNVSPASMSNGQSSSNGAKVEAAADETNASRSHQFSSPSGDHAPCFRGFQGDASPTPSSSSNESSNNEGGVKKCRFNDCDNPSVEGTSKCAFHKNRRQCGVENCTNQVYARKLCVRHGGKKQCQADGCDAHARGGGFCLPHGGFVVKRFCIVDGCSKQAHARQKCVRHGGGRRCKVEGCAQHARAGGLCNRHSHGHQCRMEGCFKTAQHSGSICFRHAMEMRAHGQEVPELNIAKGGRAPKRRDTGIDHAPGSESECTVQETPTSLSTENAQSEVIASLSLSSNGVDGNSMNNNANPFGLPLKITVPTNLPKMGSGRTPLGGFPTPRTHDFSLLMGLPSPQIDNSQLPSVLAMSNSANRQQSDQTSNLCSSFTPGQGLLRSSSRADTDQKLFSYAMGTTANKPQHSSTHHVGEEDFEAILNGYVPKFMPSNPSASPIAYQPHIGQYAVPAIPDTVGVSIFDASINPVPNVSNMSTSIRNALVNDHFPPSVIQQSTHSYLARSKLPNYVNPSAPVFDSFAITSNGSASVQDYASQFFVDNQDQPLFYQTTTSTQKRDHDVEASQRAATPTEMAGSRSSSSPPSVRASSSSLAPNKTTLQPTPLHTGVRA